MFDEIDDLRVNLREAADGFRPALDADELARTGRRRQRRNRIIGGVAGAAALLVVAGIGVPAALSLRPGIPASPAGGRPRHRARRRLPSRRCRVRIPRAG